ncbi:putative methyltransferase NSUN7 [Gadus chalcogrammus]|uniref:putative methyltransferase NSUN7 n=1 Tax=Gadus chalcogrammus TaxID=1042646 RepID=UPI0024C402DB|nr:putative methyltransferase NSUN7 [Gadus chalcogrammus]
MEQRFVDPDRVSPVTDPPRSSLSSGGGRPPVRLPPSEPTPAHPPSGKSASAFPLEDQVYLGAGALFGRLRTDRPVTQQLLHYGKKETTPIPEGHDKTRLRQAYQLAFNTLKYQDLLENVILDSCFHTSQQIPDDLLPLAMVMLFDLQDRKFELLKRRAEEGEEPLQDVRELESCFRRSKTKLAASLARCRVKQNLVSVSCVLPDPVRTNQKRAKLLPFYAWVNPLTSSVEEVCGELQADLGLHEVERMQDSQGGLQFCRDPLCEDTLCFPPQLHTLIEQSPLVAGHTLNAQHRGVCLAVSALRPHLPDHADVLVAGSFSACTLAQVAVHAAARSGKVLVCGDDHTPSQRDELQELLTRMHINNVRVLPVAFQSLDEWDSAAQRLRLMLLLPQSSCSALSDPVHTLITEHGDVDVLQDLSQGPVSQSRLDSLVHHQEKLLAHALTFPRVQSVLYCTRSVYPQENEHLVIRALNKADTPPKLVPFRPAPPLLPQPPGSETTDSRFFKIEPSGHSDGCFIARLTRESDATKVEKVQDVLARAAAKGLLGAMFGDQSQPSRKGRRRKSSVLAANQKSCPPLPALTEDEPVAGQTTDLDPDPGEHQDPVGGLRTTDTPSMTEEGDEEEDGAADEKEEDVEEGNDGSPGEGTDTGKGVRKGKGRARRRTKRSHGAAKLSAVQPNRTGRKTLKTKVKPKRRQGPGRTFESTSEPPTRSAVPRPTTSTGQGSTPVTPATYVLQLGPGKEQQGQKAHARKPMKKAGTPGRVSSARGAGSANEVSVQDPAHPSDPVHPLVSSFSRSSLSNSASSRSTAPSSSSSMSSVPTSTTQTRSPF